MSGRVLGGDTITKRRVDFHEEDGRYIVDHRQEVEDILEENYENRKERRGFKGDGFHHVGQIPLVIYEDLMRKGIVKDNKELLAWLDANPEWKTHPGRLT